MFTSQKQDIKKMECVPNTNWYANMRDCEHCHNSNGVNVSYGPKSHSQKS